MIEWRYWFTVLRPSQKLGEQRSTEESKKKKSVQKEGRPKWTSESKGERLKDNLVRLQTEVALPDFVDIHVWNKKRAYVQTAREDAIQNIISASPNAAINA